VFEYGDFADIKPRGSHVSRIAGFLLFFCILLRIFASFVNTEEAFWGCFLLWTVLSMIEGFSSKRAEKSARDGLTKQEEPKEKPELPIWWKVFGPLAAFNLITIFLGLWPLGGFGILLWMISWVVYDFIDSSRFGRRGWITLSLR
jgi:hypothetical protein